MIIEIVEMIAVAHAKGQDVSKVFVSKHGYESLVESTMTAQPDTKWGWEYESPLPDDVPMAGQRVGLIVGVPVHLADSDLAPALSFEIT